jgi:hypothetical protein
VGKKAELMRLTLRPACDRLVTLSKLPPAKSDLEKQQFLLDYLEVYSALYAAGKLAEILLRDVMQDADGALFAHTVREPVDQTIEKLAEQLLELGG